MQSLGFKTDVSPFYFDVWWQINGYINFKIKETKEWNGEFDFFVPMA